MKKWLRAQPGQPTTIAQLQALLDTFVDEYNHRRPAPVPAAPRHPRHGLRGPPESHPQRRPEQRHPRPGPHRPHRRLRLRHPARQRPAAPHRHRPNPRPNPRPAARPGPRRPRHQRRHRRTPPRTHPRPHPRLPTHRSTQRTHPATDPKTTKAEPTNVGSAVADVLRHHTVELAGIEPASSSVEPGLLRVQSVTSHFSAPALALTRRRQAQSGKSPDQPS